MKRRSTQANLGKRGASASSTKRSNSIQPKSTSINLKWDEDIDSSEGEDEEFNGKKKGKKESRDDGSEEEDSEGESETAEQKRRRLAKEYLANLQNDEDNDEGHDDDEEEYDINDGETGAAAAISESLKRNRLEKQGKYFRNIASNASSINFSTLTKQVMTDHDQSVTCVALSTDERVVYSGSKDNSVILWDLESNNRRVLRPKWTRATHGDEQCCKGEILSIAVSSDGRYLASGGRDMIVRIHDTRIAESEVRAFQGHRDAITSLAFRRDSYSLFSGSLDRCVKHWDLNEMGYLETLFGHQDGVTAVDCWTQERPVSASSDRTCRLWKISDETHLVFRGHKSTADCVQIMTDDSYLSGGQDGSICLWKETQKKPIASVLAAHEYEGVNPRWICSMGVVKMSDYAATGSNDGNIRFWKISPESRKLEQVNSIALDGFVNSLALSTRLVVAGTGREHRLGRWWNTKGNKNKVTVFRLPQNLDIGVGCADNLMDDDSYGDCDDDEEDTEGGEEEPEED